MSAVHEQPDRSSTGKLGKARKGFMWTLVRERIQYAHLQPAQQLWVSSSFKKLKSYLKQVLCGVLFLVAVRAFDTSVTET